ncbi:MAG: PASTA domain-containing protein [Rikenellaceae bacterium]|nr:PASTA domain-containing protein [Rikenellaceae bacterium]MCL2692701.1 PASTA domain-containing protein [Rikenellaceae bacterium]
MNLFVKNLILALCAIVVFVWVTSMLLKVVTRHDRHEVVPDFHNMSMDEAMLAARKGRLRIEINDSIFRQYYTPGVILHQMPAPGTEVKAGRRVLVTTNAHTRRMALIPYVTGVSLRQARNNLEVAGFEIERLIYRNDIATNYVLETRFGSEVIGYGGTLKAEQGSAVTLVVGMNPEESTAIVPKVVGLSYRQTRGRLWELGLNLGKVETEADVTLRNRDESRVWQQNPAPGSRVPLGTQVTLRLTLDDAQVATGSESSDREARRIMELRRAEEEAAAAEAAAHAAAAGNTAERDFEWE